MDVHLKIKPASKKMVKQDKGLKAVILAAGTGSRLRDGDTDIPKPLTLLLGLTLIERVILSCREVGVTDFLVVVGYQKERLIPHLEYLQGRYENISIQVVENPSWELGNGTSVLVCEPYLSGPFLLLMCDHVFDPLILRRLVATEDGSGGCWLAVDSTIRVDLDMRDATKVRIENGRMIAIGKEISPFNGIDTGLFLCYPIIFDALRAAQAEGDFSLSGGVQKLIEAHKMEWVPTDGLFWYDVDTPEALTRARSLLLSHLSKPEEDGWISRYLNRPISRHISSRLVEWKFSPNTITTISFLLSLLGGLLFAFGGYTLTLLAGILIQLASVVDGCDGEVARLMFQESRFGGWFDTVLDRYGDALIAAGITYGFWQSHPGAIPWIGCIMAILGFILASYTKKEFAIRYQRPLTEGVVGRLIKRDSRIFLLFLGAIFNRPFEALILVGLISHLGIVWLFLSVYQREKR